MKRMAIPTYALTPHTHMSTDTLRRAHIYTHTVYLNAYANTHACTFTHTFIDIYTH